MAQKVVLFKAKKDIDDNYEKVLGSIYQVTFISTLGFNSVGRNNGLIEALTNCQQFSGVVFTSQTAVSVVSELINEEKIIVKWPTEVYVVGPATEECVRSLLGVSVTQGGVAGDAKSLSDVIINSQSLDRSRPLLFPCGNISKDTLPLRLKEADIQLCSIVCYETGPHPLLKDAIVAMNWSNVSVLVFFSPSGVQFVLPLLKSIVDQQILKHIKYCAIGPSTGSALTDSGINDPLVSCKPNPQELLTVLSTAL